MIAGTMTTTGSNNTYYAGQAYVEFGPEHAQTCGRRQRARATCSALLARRCRSAGSRKKGVEGRFRRKQAEQYADAPLDAPVRMFQKPEDLVVIVTGGAGKHASR